MSDAFNNSDLSDDKLTQYAVDIDNIVKTAVAEYSINPSGIENKISMQLLPMLFADLGLEKAERFIQEVIKITHLGLSRS